MRSLFLLALLASPFAHAEYDIKDHLPKLKVNVESLHDQPGVAQLAGAVEIDPMWAFGNTPIVPLWIEGTDTPFYVILGIGESGVYLGSDVLGAAEVDAKKRQLRKIGGDVEVATVSFAIGDLAFEDVRVYSDSKSAGEDTPPVSISGYVGLNTFPELAAAFIPSQDKVVLGGSGGALIDAVGGTTLDYTHHPVSLEKYGKRTKVKVDAYPITVGGMVGEQTLDVAISTNASSVLRRGAVPGMKPALEYGLNAWYATDITLGDLTLSANLAQTNSVDHAPTRHHAVLGHRVTSAWDIAYDPMGMKLAIKPMEKPPAYDYTEAMDAKIEESMKSLSPEEGDAPTGEALAGIYAGLSGTYAQFYQWDKAAEYADKALTEDSSTCDRYMSAGTAKLRAKDFAAAEELFSSAASMYAEWDSRSLEDRTAINEALEEDPEATMAGLITISKPQPSSCYTAWGMVAQARLAQGNTAGAIEVFEKEFDVPRARSMVRGAGFDANLAMVAGNAYYLDGKVDNAESAWRQSARVGGTTGGASLSTVALVAEARGNKRQALENYAKAGLTSDDKLINGTVWVDAIARIDSPQAAADTLKAYSQGMDPMWTLAYARALKAAGQDASDAANHAVELFEQRLFWQPRDAQLLSGYAVALAHAGQAEAATAAADQAELLSPTSADVAWARAEIARAQGDAAKATEFDKVAAQLGAGNPFAAQGLKD